MFPFVIFYLHIISMLAFLNEAIKAWNIWTLDRVVFLTTNATIVSVYCNQLHVSPSKFANALVGSSMCVLFLCDLEGWLLWPDTLLRSELFLDRGVSIKGCNSSLNLDLNSKYRFSNRSRSPKWFLSSDNSSSFCAVPYLSKMIVIMKTHLYIIYFTITWFDEYLHSCKSWFGTSRLPEELCTSCGLHAVSCESTAVVVHKAQCPGRRMLNVGDFVKSRWWS